MPARTPSRIFTGLGTTSTMSLTVRTTGEPESFSALSPRSRAGRLPPALPAGSSIDAWLASRPRLPGREAFGPRLARGSDAGLLARSETGPERPAAAPPLPIRMARVRLRVAEG